MAEITILMSNNVQTSDIYSLTYMSQWYRPTHDNATESETHHAVEIAYLGKRSNTRDAVYQL
jgi:hypothetical protein